MRDSTPRWSRRGWIRRLLDGLLVDAPEQHEQLLSTLQRAGAASEDLAGALDKALSAWKLDGILPGRIQVPSRDAVKTDASSEMRVVLLKMPDLVSLAAVFELKLNALVRDFSSIACVWNKAIAAQRCPVEQAVVQSEKDMDAQDIDECDLNGQAGSCPLQPITVCDSPPDAGPFLLGRAICAAVNDCEEANQLLRGQLVARKALKHLCECMGKARLEYQWATLHKQCPCVYVRDAAALVLCDSEGRAADFADAKWQKRVAAEAVAFAARHCAVK